MLAIGAIAVGVVIGAGALATSASLGADGCPPDRDMMTFGLTHAEGDPTFERLSDAVATIARDNGYDPLSAADLERIEQASSIAAASANGNLLTVDPDLRDTDTVVDLRVRISGSEATGFLPEGGSFCARVLSGDD
jgi:hypothetical protein